MVEHRKIAVINKFFDTEARINALIEILSKVEIDTDTLSDTSKKFYKVISSLSTEEGETDVIETEAEPTEKPTE